MLGWGGGRDLFRHDSLNLEYNEIDYLLTIGKMHIPIVIKLPNEVMTKVDVEHLFEQSQIIESTIGIYVGEHICVFYRPSVKDEFKIVIDAALVESDIEGVVFAGFFYSPHFDAKLLRTELDMLYKLERILDDLSVTKKISRKWIKDRYYKRSLLQISNTC